MKHRVGVFVLLGVLVVAFVTGLGAMRGFGRPLTVVVDGHSRTLARGTTVGDLSRGGYLAQPGALVTIWGDVIEKSGGGAPSVVVNGSAASQGQRLHRGDVVTSRRGHDLVEPLVTVERFIPADSVIEGSGPVEHLVRTGSPGLARVKMGFYSQRIVATETVIPTLSTVYVRTAATSADKLVALTFDDGPWPSSTEQILGILAQKNVRATFFMVGKCVNVRPGIAQEVAAQGHVIGDHTRGHVELQHASKATVHAEILGGAESIQGATGVYPTLFRPPGGGVNERVRETAAKLGMRTVLWNVDTRDWTKPGAEQIVANAVNHVPQHAIILMHDGGGDRSQTVAALPAIIDALAGQGYSFVTVNELLSVE